MVLLSWILRVRRGSCAQIEEISGEIRIPVDPFVPVSPVSGSPSATNLEILESFLGREVPFIEVHCLFEGPTSPKGRTAPVQCFALSSPG